MDAEGVQGGGPLVVGDPQVRLRAPARRARVVTVVVIHRASSRRTDTPTQRPAGHPIVRLPARNRRESTGRPPDDLPTTKGRLSFLE
ncbi:hypothetical protein Acsp06_17070 [Actinomycetospora sp. NBRC 106375]|nr:hypothetical protein Acsp06_17070 [Actinomycetospora sp. NBRC 106375]